MKLKLNEQGLAIVVDGKPVYVHDDGKEIPFDAPAAVARISSLNGEAKTHREAKEAAEAKLTAFGDLDPTAARKAIDTVRNIDDKKLVDAGKVEEVRAAAVREFEARLQAQERASAEAINNANALNARLKTALDKEVLGGNFQRSPYIKAKIVSGMEDLLFAKFGGQFKVGEDGKLEVTGLDGNRLYSRVRPGEAVTDFEEAIELLVDQYPNRAAFMKGSGASGPGNGGRSDGRGGSGNTITRAEWESLPVGERASALQNKTLVD